MTLPRCRPNIASGNAKTAVDLRQHQLERQFDERLAQVRVRIQQLAIDATEKSRRAIDRVPKRDAPGLDVVQMHTTDQPPGSVVDIEAFSAAHAG
jgi:hypothetical protein